MEIVKEDLMNEEERKKLEREHPRDNEGVRRPPEKPTTKPAKKSKED